MKCLKMRTWVYLRGEIKLKIANFQQFSVYVINVWSRGKVAASEVSFGTPFIATLLFVEVKASRPMTYQALTVDMIESVKGEGFIDQTLFKTNQTYGFDSLYFDSEVLIQVNSYIKHLRLTAVS